MKCHLRKVLQKHLMNRVEFSQKHSHSQQDYVIAKAKLQIFLVQWHEGLMALVAANRPVRFFLSYQNPTTAQATHIEKVCYNILKLTKYPKITLQFEDRLCGLVIIGSDFGPRGPGFDSCHGTSKFSEKSFQIIWEAFNFHNTLKWDFGFN
uniref:Uncharacterized protein n=1 Tax=Timema cristinae TaxID=61476 RepID=A0A7R9CAQ8_TIMCR|nr:unnamed protein product [Timema cristinae]